MTREVGAAKAWVQGPTLMSRLTERLPFRRR